MKKLFHAIVLFLLSGVAYASSSAVTDPAITNHTDLSINYLEQIFGTVGNVLHGTSGQMLGQLFYKLNEGIVVVAGLWLAYTVFTIVLRSAQEGSFMGANKNVALAFLKIALGFALLIPNPATGYSVLQDIVMKVVVAGVGLADTTWRYGLDYVQNGGTLWHRPEDSGAGTDIVSDATANAVLGGTDQSKKGPAEQIFANAVCMYSSIDNQPSSNQPPIQYSVITDSAHQTYDFPGVGDNEPLGPGANKCGSVSWNVGGSACTDPSSPQCTYTQYAVGQLITNLLPAAKRQYCSMNSTAPSCIGINSNDVQSTNTEMFFGALINYANSILPVVQMNTNNTTNAKQFIQEAEIEGWLSAGRYYWDLSQVQSHYQAVSNVQNYAPPQPNVPTLSGQPKTDADNALSASYQYIPGVMNDLATFRNGQNSGDTGSGSYSSGNTFKNTKNWAKTGFGFIDSLLGGLLGDIANLILMFTTQGNGGWMGSDPIVFLHQIGIYCINIAGDIWIGWLGIIGSLLFGAGECEAVYNAQAAIEGMIDWIKPLLVVLAGGFWGAGFVLGFYLPMYPYFIFTFGVIGWVIAVIEAMVAAPLVCFGLTHPEGHDFLGEAKQALMLLLGAFLRPVLMVIGLIAAMILSYVSLRLVVYTFSGFAADLFYIIAPIQGPASGDILGATGLFLMNSVLHAAVGGSLTGLVLSLLVFPMMLAVFTALIYVVTTYCFSLIFVLPDNILRWIGGPSTPGMATQMAQQIQGVFGQGANMTGQGIKAGKENREQQQKIRQAGQMERGNDPKSPGSSGSASSSGSKK